MGITRDPVSKRRSTGGRQKQWHKKRKYALARPAALTKLGAKRIHSVRVRGGAIKYRGIRLDSGNFSWGSEVATRKARILNVVYNAANNEFVRTNTLVKGGIVQIDSTPFRQYYEKHYGVSISKKGTTKKSEKKDEEAAKASGHVTAKLKARVANHKLDPRLEEQLAAGKIYAAIASRPGQVGRADGYILEGAELEFYVRKLRKK